MTQSDLKKLKKPLPLKWRVQRAYPTKIKPTHVILIGYVDARQVEDILDEVCGPENWQDEYFESKNKQFCKIGIRVDGEWIWKSDSGEPSSTSSSKGETSDAFKRAAVKWGINRVAYKVGEVKLPCKMWGEKDPKPYPVDEFGNFIKGQKLFDLCNRLGKIEDYEIEFDKSFESPINSVDSVIEKKDSIKKNNKNIKVVMP